jgi:hypothetical protein
MSTKNQQKVDNKQQGAESQQKPTNDHVHAIAPPRPTRGTRKPAAIPEQPVAVIVSSDTPPEPAKAPAKAPKNAKRPTADTPTPAPDDAGETVVFAFRLTRSERDEIHAATGSAKASKFVKAIVLAGARGDMKAVQEIVDEIHAAKQ